jgi:hypothetical protein
MYNKWTFKTHFQSQNIPNCIDARSLDQLLFFNNNWEWRIIVVHPNSFLGMIYSRFVADQKEEWKVTRFPGGS